MPRAAGPGPIAAPAAGEDRPFGVYVHVPFCVSRCDYCAFATWTDRFHLAERYVAACVAEIRRAPTGWPPSAGALSGGVAPPPAGWPAGVPRPASSVFFGGGTPSLLPARLLGQLLSAVPISRGAEVTVECNPDTVDTATLRSYADVGVTRLSFGVQSMVPHVLRALGRRHDVEAARAAVRAASAAGFAGRYSVDLIYGAAGESLEDWRATISAVLALDPPPAHVSAYALTVERGTPLAADRSRHPDPDDQADKYLLADELFAGAGLRWYEISNWAAPGAECRHNQLYWRQGEYLGVGCAAHSHARVRHPVAVAGVGGSRRWWNVRTPERYVDQVESGRSVVAAGEVLTPAEQRLEALQLSLRTRAGVPGTALAGWREDPALDGLLATAPGDRAVLTARGRLLASEVALRLHASPAPR